MRVLHLVHQYMPDHVGGTELYTRWLTRAQCQQGHQVTVFYRRSGEGTALEKRTEKGVDVWAAWTGSVNPTGRFLATFRDLAMTFVFDRILEETAPDLIHIEHLMGYPVSLVHSIRQKGIPYVITLWDFWWMCANANLLTNYDQQVCDGPRLYLNCARCALARIGKSFLWPLAPSVAGLLAWRNRLLGQVMRNASKILAPTEFVNRWYVAHNTPTEKLLTGPPGLELVTPFRLRPRKKGVLRFAYIGGLSRIKGVHTIVEAFGGLQNTESVELWIAGDESFDPAYVARLRTKSTSKIRFLGRLTREQVWETLSRVDVVLVPSLCYETFSFIISEAFAAKVPVVASRLGPLVDRVQDGVNGLLVPPGDVLAWRKTLRQLIDNPDLLAQMQANVQSPTTIEEHVSRIDSIYTCFVERD